MNTLSIIFWTAMVVFGTVIGAFSLILFVFLVVQFIRGYRKEQRKKRLKPVNIGYGVIGRRPR